MVTTIYIYIYIVCLMREQDVTLIRSRFVASINSEGASREDS